MKQTAITILISAVLIAAVRIVRKYQKSKYSRFEIVYNIDKLIEKYSTLDKRISEMERASRKATGSENYWDKTE